MYKDIEVKVFDEVVKVFDEVEEDLLKIDLKNYFKEY